MGGEWKLRGYIIERLLGSGASGDVWRARVAATGDLVALKRIVVADPAQALRAREEARLLSALDHPNLVRLHALVPSEDSLVLVLDLADGGSLSDVLAARGRLTPGEVITALSPIAATVSYLHSQAVIHGDVSAANILFTESGAPLLCDVGVARLTGDQRDAEATPAYVDPAVASGSVPGPPSDVFSLGAVTFHALTGAPIWWAYSAEETLALAARGVPDDVPERLHSAGVPEAMSAAVLRALARDPHRRGTAVELALDLRQSATPLAVELHAGRARREPRLRDRATPQGEHIAPAHTADAAGRPDFERPGPQPGDPGSEPPTRMVVPRPRPTIPRSSSHRRPPAIPRRMRLPLITGAAFITITAAVLGFVLMRGDGPVAAAPHRAPASVTASASGAATPSPSAVSRAEPSRTEPSRTSEPASAANSGTGSGSDRSTVTQGDAATWVDALTALDAVRSEAYATRTPALLSHVYVPGQLLNRDRAQLLRLVPAGCGLTGALTTYELRDVHSVASRSVVIVTASLPATRLVCAGNARVAAPPTPRTRLRIELTQTADGPRISAERRI